MGDASVAASADDGATTAGAATGGASKAGGGHGGGGGGGDDSANKTELSRTVTVSGSVETTVITYTDGTSDTTTGAATSEDQARYGDAAAKADGDTKAADYLSTIPPGTLVDTEA
jgi:hypothetical protein